MSKIPPTILVTGFGPFPGMETNPSGHVATRIDAQIHSGVRFIGQLLPTSWAKAFPILGAAAQKHRPKMLIMLGVAAQRSTICIERSAQNYCGGGLDIDGICPPTGPLTDGPSTLITTLPWADLCGDGVVISDDAGDYLCNAVFFEAMRHLSTIPYRGFIHIPNAPTDRVVDLLLKLAEWLAQS